MTDTKGFPPVQNGNCDGLGCGDKICWCDEHTAMAEEYQRLYNKQWDLDSPECRIFEDGWRVGNKFIKLANELYRKLDSYELRVQKWNSDRYLWLQANAFSVEPTQVTVLPLVLTRGKYSQLHRDPEKVIALVIDDEIRKEQKLEWAANKANQTPKLESFDPTKQNSDRYEWVKRQMVKLNAGESYVLSPLRAATIDRDIDKAIKEEKANQTPN